MNVLFLLAFAASPADVGDYEARRVAALDAGTVEAMLPLVQLPLRINGPRGASVDIANETALDQRYDEVFPPAWQARIRAAAADGRIHRNADFGIAHGAAWLNAFGEEWRMVVVNLPDDGPGPDREIVLACGTGEAFYRIERDGDGFIVATDGRQVEATVESGGTGPCYARSWTFEATRVAEIGCVQDPPPERARAEVETTAFGPSLPRWCW